MIPKHTHPRFISFESGEGAGKTTQLKIIEPLLEDLGYEVVIIRDPGGTPIADKIRAILLDSTNVGISHKAEFLLYCASRAQLVYDAIIPALDRGAIVLSDRFYDSTRVYQHMVRTSVNNKLLMDLNDYVTDNGHGTWYQPSLTLVLDIDTEIGLRRSLRRLHISEGPNESRLELEGLEFHKKITESYRIIANDFPDRVKLIDANKSIEQVTSSLMNLIVSHLKLNVCP